MVLPFLLQIYVVDLSNHRIQVLNPDLTFSCSFGSYGQDKGQFVFPGHIAIDSQGSVYVSDHCNVQKFTSSEGFWY